MPARLLETFAADVRFGARTLARNPGFAAVALLTLALGIGATAAIFSVVNAVLLRPLPWAEPDRAVMIWSKWVSFDKTWVSEGEVNAYRARSRTMAEVAAWSDGQTNVTGDGEPERVPFAQVSANLFSTLGVRPALGRTFRAGEDVPNGPDLVVLGHGLWTRRFAASPGAIGTRILLNGRPHEIVGIMPNGFLLPTDFQNPEPSQLWTLLPIDPSSTNYGDHGWYAAGRLRPGVSVKAAADEFHGIAQALVREGLHPAQMQFDTVVLSLREEVVGPVRRSVLLLFGAVGFLLLIACANVANLLLARAESRQREIAVRSALGAGVARVVTQMLAESLVLTLCATAAGLGLAWAIVRFVAWWNPANIPRIADITVDPRVLAFTLVVALVTSFLFGLAPALRAIRVDLNDALKEGHTTTAGRQRQHFRSSLVVVEMALAVMLLTGAGLMIRSLWSLQRVELGFDASNVLTLRLSLPQAGYGRPEEVVLFYQRLLERVRTLPGVERAGAVRALPLASTIGDWGLQIDGYVPPSGTNAKGDWQIVTDGYLETLGERLVRGRSLSSADRADTQLVGLINEEMARRYWSGRDPIGGRFKIGGPQRPWVTIVGIVADVKHNGITAVTKEKFYVPHAQWHVSVGNPMRAMSLVVKTTGEPARLVSSVRQEIRALDPALPISNVRTMDEVVSATLSAPRFTGALLAGFAALAIVLSAIGIYGVLSFVVNRRTREIGIRVAMGADRSDVLRLVLKQGLTLSIAGLVIGLAAAVWVSRFMSELLHGVAPADPLTFGSAAIMLVAVSIAASLVPALRAARVDPLIALKAE